MTQARRKHIPPNTSCYVHCTSRCVRKAWLCGLDSQTGTSYDHRRTWVEDRLLLLAEVFSVSIYAYAVMANHVHVVLKLDAVAAGKWSDEEIARRWCRLYPAKDDPKNLATRIQNIAGSPELVAEYRDRLRDLGWFMKGLNQHIALKANTEDDCTGRFWQGRYKSQVLLDERALLAAMVYADLNPIRAKVAVQLNASDHTGIRRRILHLKDDALLARQPLAPVCGLAQEGLSIQTKDYLALVDYTGRQWHRDKPGRISPDVPPILQQLKLDTQEWNRQVRCVGTKRFITLGSVEALIERAAELGQKWLAGIGLARILARPA